MPYKLDDKSFFYVSLLKRNVKKTHQQDNATGYVAKTGYRLSDNPVSRRAKLRELRAE
jgi:hypothetical protein